MPDPHPLPRAYLPTLLLAALALRLACAFITPSDDNTLQRLPDQVGYLDLARNLLHQQSLVRVDPRFDDLVYAGRMPLYPLFLAFCGANVIAIRAAQAILDTSTVLAVYLLARNVLTRRPSLLAAAFVAFNPFLIFFSSLILTETLFTSMLAWAMVLLTRHIPLLWGGLLLASSILVRPSAIALPVILGIAAAFLPHHQRSPRHTLWTLPVGSAMLLLTLLALLPWALRNHALLGQWVWTTTDAGFVAFDGFNDQATGASDQKELSSLEWNRQLRRLTEIQRSQLLQRHARQWAAQTAARDPFRLLKLSAIKVARTWSPVPLSHDFSSPRNTLIALLFSLPFYFLVICGLSKNNLPLPFKTLLLLPAIYFTIVHALSVGSLRYRVPTEPLLAVLAAAGAVAVLKPRQPLAPRPSPQSLNNNIVHN